MSRPLCWAVTRRSYCSPSSAASRQRNVAIVFISHRLDEVFQIADSVTVLKDGVLVGTVPIGAVTHDKLVTMMIGRNLADIYPAKAKNGEIGDVAIEAKDLVVGTRVKGVSFQARKGEVLGIAGMVGSGRTELAHAVFGSLHVDGGEIYLAGQKVGKPTPAPVDCGRRRISHRRPQGRRAVHAA